MKKDESTEMRSKVVIDTNIFISALIAKGNPRKILELWGEKRFVLCINDLIIEEIKEVGMRDRFRRYFSANTINELIKSIDYYAINSKHQNKNVDLSSYCYDPDDQIFVDCIISSKCDYFITGNIKDFKDRIYELTHMMTPNNFVQQFA